MIVKKNKIILFIQARMSSNRLRGKVLKKINRITILEQVFKRVSNVFNKKDIVILTSKETDDDKIYNLCIRKNFNVFRGNLENVGIRYNEALKTYKCNFFFRVTGDSPLLDSNSIKLFLKTFYKNTKIDLISNVVNRTFPKGQSLEMINTDTFTKNIKIFSKYNENFTQPFYKKNNFRIISIENHLNLSKYNLSVDTVNDLDRIRKIFYKFKDIDQYNFNSFIK